MRSPPADGSNNERRAPAGARHRRRRLHRLGGGAAPDGDDGRQGDQSRRAHLRRRTPLPRPGRRRPALRLRARRHRATPRRCEPSSPATGRTSSSISPPRPTSTARSTRPRAFVATNIVGTAALLSETLAYWRGLLAARAARSASSTSPPTRCSAPWGRSGHVRRDEPYDPALALFGLQGGRRPSGARLEPHLWPAGADHQLLQQLWARGNSPRSSFRLLISVRSTGEALPVYGDGRTCATGCMSMTMRAP